MNHGRHVKVVGEGSAALLGSPDTIREFLIATVEKLGMRMLGAPVIHDVEIDIAKLGAEPFEDEGGVTGFVVLSTSHCSIHTWPAREKPEFVLDLYSCRDFSVETMTSFVREALGATALHITDVSDSLRTPSEMGLS